MFRERRSFLSPITRDLPCSERSQYPNDVPDGLTIADIEKALEIAEKIRLEVYGPKIKIGIMVEVPSAAIMADHFAE